MSNERLNAALRELQRSRVYPELVSDEAIMGLRSRRGSALLWLTALGVIAFAGVAMWVNSTRHEQPQESVQGPNEQHGAVALRSNGPTPLVDDAVVNTVGASAGAVSRDDLGSVDPRSIVVVDLSDEELSTLGIGRAGDTVYVTMQSLVAEDTSLAKKLGLGRSTLLDSSVLFHWRCSATPDGVGNIVPTTFDGVVLDHLAPFWVYSIDSVNHPRPVRYVSQAIVEQSARDNELSINNLQFLYTAVVDSLSYKAYLPTTQLPRDLKPIIVHVRNRHTQHRVLVLYMPTDRFMARLPRRFERVIRHCYDPYQPKLPKVRTYPKATPQPEANLVKIEGVVGQPFVELTDEQLMRFGISRDSVTVFRQTLGSTLDTSLTSFRRFETISFGAVASPYMLIQYRNGVMYNSINGTEVSKVARQSVPIATLETVEVEGVNGVTPQKTRSASIAYRLVSGTKIGLYADFPHAAALAEKVAITLGNRGIPTDSLACYWVVENGVSVPVTRLLIPIRVSTPWVTSIRFTTSPRRLTHVFWYLPTKDVLDSLPAELVAFLKPEYEAVIRSIEEKLSASALCSLLDKPSALGLCSIGDTVLRLDGIGPIPARDAMTIFLRSTKATMATIAVVDDAGQTVHERAGMPVEPGNNQLRLDLSTATIGRGAYTVVVRTEIGVRTSRVLIER